ncbi:hypothetical protein WDW89_24715 [Deltaproteobacteria bacterium TL4]
MFVSEAQIRLEEIIFKDTQSRKTVDAYDGYLSKYPKGKYVQQVQTNREELYYQAAVSKNTVQSYDGYLSEYPKGKYVQQVQTNREELYYQAAVSKNTVQSYDGYLSEYPNDQDKVVYDWKLIKGKEEYGRKAKEFKYYDLSTKGNSKRK